MFPYVTVKRLCKPFCVCLSVKRFAKSFYGGFQKRRLCPPECFTKFRYITRSDIAVHGYARFCIGDSVRAAYICSAFQIHSCMKDIPEPRQRVSFSAKPRSGQYEADGDRPLFPVFRYSVKYLWLRILLATADLLSVGVWSA